MEEKIEQELRNIKSNIETLGIGLTNNTQYLVPALNKIAKALEELVDLKKSNNQ